MKRSIKLLIAGLAAVILLQTALIIHLCRLYRNALDNSYYGQKADAIADEFERERIEGSDEDDSKDERFKNGWAPTWN